MVFVLRIVFDARCEAFRIKLEERGPLRGTGRGHVGRWLWGLKRAVPLAAGGEAGPEAGRGAGAAVRPRATAMTGRPERTEAWRAP